MLVLAVAFFSPEFPQCAGLSSAGATGGRTWWETPSHEWG